MNAKEVQEFAKDKALLVTFQRLVNLKHLQWDEERKIENIIGHAFTNMNGALEDICAVADNGVTCTNRDLMYYLRQLKEDH
jgi:hypothetical protein